MKLRFQLTLALMLTHLTLADIKQASKLVQEGKPADALAVLADNDSPEGAFWRGRALIALGRTRDAADALRHVPDAHPLYPYAAKALLYCAWQNKDVDFAVIATPMATCSNKEIATLATAALAEYWLGTPRSHDNSALERFRSMVKEHPEYTKVLRLLEIENLRLRGEFDKAIAQCRAMEADTNLPVSMRHRARLALANVYYDKEESHIASFSTGFTPTATADQDEPGSGIFDDGKGEETLLHFISSHPDSPLLEEAFRRLCQRNAFATSEYAKAKLAEWAEDTQKPRRAANALLVIQHNVHQNEEADRNHPLNVACANKAVASFPGEKATRTILLEQIRWYLEREEPHQALPYMGMLQGNDVVRRFYEAQMRAADMASTAREYLDCAREASEPLRSVALENALISALLANDKETEEAVLNLKDLSEAQHVALLRTRAAFWLQSAPERAEEDINILQSLPIQDINLKADIEMDYAFLRLYTSPESARGLLLKSDINKHLPKLSPERQLRFFALQEAAIREIASTDDSMNAERECMQLILQAAGKVTHPRVVSILTMHLAHLQATEGLYEDSISTLKSLLRKYPMTDFAPHAMYMAARIRDNMGTMESLKKAAQSYEICAKQSESMRIKATIRKAAVLLRLGNHEEAEQILTHLLRVNTDMRSQDKLMARAVLANSKALQGTEEGRKEAIDIAGIALEDAQLPRWWKQRALLHHATLCERADRYAEALKDYEEVLSMQPAMGTSPSAADWHILYSAGSGAVLQLIHLKRYDEAADKADQIAAWNKEKASLSKRKQFSDWAAFIRQTNFVENKNQPF